MAEILHFASSTLSKIGNKYHLETSYDIQEDFPAVENDNELTDFMINTASANGYETTEPDTPFRWSEDFSQYLTEFRGAFIGIGSGLETKELHHPDYDFPDEIIEKAAEFLSLISHRINTLH